MIARIWRGRATPERADTYFRHVTERVFPSLESIPGHRGAWLLRRETGGQVEFLVLTLWDSMEAVARFAGADPSVAVVEPAARAALEEFDEIVAHYELLHASGPSAG